MSEDLQTIEREYELVEPITERLYQEACAAIDADPEEIRLDPDEAADKIDPDVDQMQRFCEIVLQDFDMRIPELPAPQGRVFFTTVLTEFWRGSSGRMLTQSAVLNAFAAAPTLPTFVLTDPESA